METSKRYDIIIVGGGLIGISLALALRKHGATVMIVDRSQPGREASHAAGGMLAHCDPALPVALQPLARASASLYPEFVREIESESQVSVDYRRDGTITLSEDSNPKMVLPEPGSGHWIDANALPGIEPELRPKTDRGVSLRAAYLPESSIDPRELVRAALLTAKQRHIQIVSGAEVTEIVVRTGRVAGVRTLRASYDAEKVVNCAGAWAGQLTPEWAPIRPVKGQMLALAAHIRHDAHGTPIAQFRLNHVVRAPGVYLVPRSNGRILVGSTLEEAGYDKRVDPAVIQRLHEAASILVPAIAAATILESWAGLRPGTPDDLPILGETELKGYYIAAGHYREGILLAPITAVLMAQLMQGVQPDFDLSAFSPARFTGGC